MKGWPEDYGMLFFGMSSDNLINTKLNLSDFDTRVWNIAKAPLKLSLLIKFYNMIHFVYLPTGVCLLIHPSDDFLWCLGIRISGTWMYSSPISTLPPSCLSWTQEGFQGFKLSLEVRGCPEAYDLERLWEELDLSLSWRHMSFFKPYRLLMKRVPLCYVIRVKLSFQNGPSLGRI